MWLVLPPTPKPQQWFCLFCSLASGGVWPKMNPKDDQTESNLARLKDLIPSSLLICQASFFETNFDPQYILTSKLWHQNFSSISPSTLGSNRIPTPCWFPPVLTAWVINWPKVEKTASGQKWSGRLGHHDDTRLDGFPKGRI